MKSKFKTEYKEASGSIGFIFWKVSNYHQRMQREALKDLDITPTQFSLLACYYYIGSYRKEPPSQALVAEHSGLDKMVVSDITKALLIKKLILKKKNKMDKRAFQIQLTAKGETVCNDAVKVIEALDKTFFGKTGDAQHFLQMLIRIFEGPV